MRNGGKTYDFFFFVGLCFTILTRNLDVQHVCKIHSVTSYGWIKREMVDYMHQLFATNRFHKLVVRDGRTLSTGVRSK
jgi:hypothetical protein